MPRVSNDVMRMKFISFALKYDAKRWMYSLNVGGIPLLIPSLRDISLLARPSLSNEILSFAQLEQEPLWGYMSRFKELLV